MLNKKELITVGIAILILSISLGILDTWKNFGYLLLSIFIIISLNVFSKKIIAYYLDSKIEIDLWKIKRFGFKPGNYFKRAFLKSQGQVKCCS